MIENIPEAEDLEKVALRLYFNAWTELVRLCGISDVAVYEAFGYSDASPEAKKELEEEKQHLLQWSQPDLQVIYTMIQQSLEIGLKAILCRISPFALLLGSDIRTWPSKPKDFTSYRSIDAADLPKAIASLSDTPLSEEFVQSFHEFRKNRNQIAHIGVFQTELEPHNLLKSLITQFGELYPNKNWIKERLKLAEEQISPYLTHKRYTETTMLWEELEVVLPIIENKHYKTLFNISKAAKRHVCDHCVQEAYAHDAGIDPVNVRTAVYQPDTKSLNCIVCGSTVEYMLRDCSHADCNGKFTGKDYWEEEMCLLCGRNNESPIG